MDNNTLLAGPYCGSFGHPIHLGNLRSHALRIVFRSNEDIAGKGFSVHISAVGKENKNPAGKNFLQNKQR